jgi:CheY-like chemotaxis protein
VFTIKMPLLSIAQSRPELLLDGVNCFVAMSSTIEGETLAKIIACNGGTVSLLDRSNLLMPSDQSANTRLLVDVPTMRQLLKSGADFSNFTNKVILIEPGDRGNMAEFHGLGFETYLVRPVRQKSLVRLLSGKASISDTKGTAPRKQGSVKSANKALSILVAEDNAINALMVKAALMRAGHSVMVVGDGRSAVNEINARPHVHDLVLMDLHMPVMDGLDAIAAIRNGEDENGRKPVPILALTADGQAEVEKAVRAVGGNGYVTKPVDPARLIGLIEETAAAA